jgi:plastocyanin
MIFNRQSKANLLFGFIIISTSNLVFAAEVEVLQQAKKFSVEKINVKVGDSVKFTNTDPFSHNVYSLSESKSFDLGTYPKGVSKSITFDKPGSVEVECAVHPNMKMIIEVAK